MEELNWTYLLAAEGGQGRGCATSVAMRGCGALLVMLLDHAQGDHWVVPHQQDHDLTSIKICHKKYNNITGKHKLFNYMDNK